MALTEDAHQLIRDHFLTKEKQLAIDATCGNGYDTQFLGELGFSRVIGFDIQKVAIEASAHRMKRVGLQNVELVQAGHELIKHYVDSPIDCVMFNFGYLPNGDKSLTTDTKNSVAAINAATNLLSNSGLISLMCYPGHPAGAIETQAIRECFATLEKCWIIETHLAVSPKPTAPILYILKRK